MLNSDLISNRPYTICKLAKTALSKNLFIARIFLHGEIETKSTENYRHVSKVFSEKLKFREMVLS